MALAADDSDINTVSSNVIAVHSYTVMQQQVFYDCHVM